MPPTRGSRQSWDRVGIWRSAESSWQIVKNWDASMTTQNAAAPIKSVKEGGPIVLFDAVCVLCSANARFILEHDRRRRFRLASMQGNVGSSIYRSLGMDPGDPSTLLVVDGDEVKRDSDAVLAIYAGLGFPWKLSSIFSFIPRQIRDPIYRMVARNRYRLFGKRNTCWIAPAHFKDRIL
jgi:predicted DCC family thiol-disulfide oxidoreductase YuxK